MGTSIGAMLSIAVLLFLLYLWMRRMRTLENTNLYRTPFLRQHKPVSSQKELEEDLLKYLYAHTEGISVAEYSTFYAIPSVKIDVALNALAQRQLVVPPSFQLTVSGNRAAENLLRRHRLYETYLCERTGIPPSEWHGIAERMEHVLDDSAAENLARTLGYPQTDPHGDPIWQRKEQTESVSKQRLSDATELGWYEVVQLGDKNKMLYETLDRLGFYPGAKIQLTGSLPTSVTVHFDGELFSLERELAEQVYIGQPTTPPPAGLVRLSALPLGVEAVVFGIAGTCHGANRRRLQDLGFVEGSAVSVDLESPLGNPTAYLIRGTTIALRSDQARHIQVLKK